MIKTISTLVDFHHILHPKELKDKADHDKPTLFRRIAGVVLLALSVPFTLGIVTGLYIYWAHRKVVHIEKQNSSDLDQRIEKVFGKAVKGEEIKPEQGIFEDAVRALHTGNSKKLMAKVTAIAPEQTNDQMKNALIAAAIAYDRIDELDQLWTHFGTVYLPLHEAKSPEMIATIVDNVSGDKQAFVDKVYGNEKNTALHHQQNLGVVKALTERRANFLQNAKGETPLHLCKDPEIAEYLIDHFGVEILEAKDDSGRTPLFTASAAVKRVLIKKGADVKATEDNGKTILHYFSEDSFKEDPKLIHTILRQVKGDERKDFVNAQGSDGAVALAENLPLNVVKALVKAGAKFPEAGKKSPLHDCEDPEVAKFLIKKFGNEIVQYKGSVNKFPVLFNKNLEVLRVFIQEMENITIGLDQTEDTILAWFSADPLKSHPELIHDVLARIKNADELKQFVNKVNTEGKAPLHYKLPAEVVKALVEAGAEYPTVLSTTHLNSCDDPELAKFLIEKFGKGILTQKDQTGRIPLAVNKNLEVLKVFIQEMEDITVTVDERGHTILHYFDGGRLKDNPELVDDVLARINDPVKLKAFVNKETKAGWTPLMYNVPLHVVKALLDAGADYYLDDKGTHLHYCKDPETVEFLCERFGTGEDHLERVDQYGRTPLMTSRNPAVIQLLIEKGAKVDAVNARNGFQPLFYAQTVAVVEKLLAAGAALDAKVLQNRSLLFGYISPEVAQWLISEHGFDVQQKDDEGNEPIHLLKNHDDNVELAKVLYGQRGKDFDWQDKEPAIMQNAKFRAWLDTL